MSRFLQKRATTESVTFAAESTAGVHDAGAPSRLVVDGVVFRETLETQMRRQTLQLLVRHRFAHEGGQFLQLAPQILRPKRNSKTMKRPPRYASSSGLVTRFMSS